MTAHELEVLTLETTPTPNDQDEEYSIPLDISDIITICREYNQLGWQIQNQVENILEIGVEESIKNGNVKQSSLPQIKKFLHAVCANPYFGDAVSQAHDCIKLIVDHQEKQRVAYSVTLN